MRALSIPPATPIHGPTAGGGRKFAPEPRQPPVHIACKPAEARGTASSRSRRLANFTKLARNRELTAQRLNLTPQLGDFGRARGMPFRGVFLSGITESFRAPLSRRPKYSALANQVRTITASIHRAGRELIVDAGAEDTVGHASGQVGSDKDEEMCCCNSFSGKTRGAMQPRVR